LSLWAAAVLFHSTGFDLVCSPFALFALPAQCAF